MILKASDIQPPDDRARKLAKEREKRIRDAIVAMLSGLGLLFTGEAVLRLIERLDTPALNARLAGKEAQDLIIAGYQPIADTFLDAARQAANDNFLGFLPYDALAAGGPLQILRDQLSQTVIDQARQAIQQVLLQGLREGLGPNVVAARLGQIIGLDAPQARAVANFRRMLEAGDSTALRRALRDEKYDALVRRAIRGEATLSPEKIDEMVAAYARRALAHRAQRMAGTEAMQAAVSGIRDAYVQAVNSGRLYDSEVKRWWLTAADERTCFTAGTMVATARGDRRIETIRPGDRVATRAGLRRVIATATHQTCKPIVVVRTSDGRCLSMTEDHPIFSGGRWTAAGDLRPGDELKAITDDGVSISSVAKIILADANGRPAFRQQDAVSARVFRCVTVPIATVNLDGDTMLDEGEVDRVAPEAVFLNERDAETLKRLSRDPLRRRFRLGTSVAGKATVAAAMLARRFAKLCAAGLTADIDRGAAALFRAIDPRVPAFAGEGFSAPLAGDVGRVRQATCLGANGVTISYRRRDTERPQALWARLFGVARPRVVTFTRAEPAASDRRASWGPEQFLAHDAVDRYTRDSRGMVAIGRAVMLDADSSADELRATLIACLGIVRDDDFAFCDELSGHRIIRVFDLQVDENPEFFASGVLVHNCHICASVPVLNSSGVGVNEPYKSIEGPLLAPLAHPLCRCSERYQANLSRLTEQPFRLAA